MVDERDGVYTIAVASRLTAMHPQTLRKYERAGLLTPARQGGNQRLYSEADVRRLRRIRHLVEVRGLNIAGLGLALAMADRLDLLPSDATLAELQSAILEASEMSHGPSTRQAPVADRPGRQPGSSLPRLRRSQPGDR